MSDNSDQVFWTLCPTIPCTVILFVIAFVQLLTYEVDYMGHLEAVDSVQQAQLKLKREWVDNHFIMDVFVIEAGDGHSCSAVKEFSEPLFSYDFAGLLPYYLTWNRYKKAMVGTLKSFEFTFENELVNPGFPMIQGSIFLGKEICATKSKASF